MLADSGQLVGMALGGAEVAPAGAAVGVLAAGLFSPWLLGAGAVAAAAAGAGKGGVADTTPPSGQTGALAAASDSGAKDNITNITKPTIIGKAEAGAAVEVSFRDAAGKLTGPYKPTSLDANGNYTLQVPNDLVDASVDTKGTLYTPVIKVTDAASNSSTADGTPFTVDTRAAAVTALIDADANNDGYINAAEKALGTTTSITALLDKAKMVAGDVITLSDGTNTKTLTLTDADIGTGKVVSTGWPLPTAEGQALNITATVKDLAGNVSPVTLDNAVLDTAVPNGGAAVGLTIDLDVGNDGTINASDKGAAKTTSLTASFDPTKVNAGDTVTFSDGTTTKSVTLTAADLTQGKVTSAGWNLPAEGATLNVTAVLKDPAANATQTAMDAAKLDTTAPNGGVAVGLTIDLDAGNDGAINFTEIGGTNKSTTTSLTATFDKNFVAVGDIITFNDSATNTSKQVTLDAAAVNAGRVMSSGWSLPTEGGTLNVTAVLKDPYGNATALANDSALVDTQIVGDVSLQYDSFKVTTENFAYKSDPQGMWKVAAGAASIHYPNGANVSGSFELADNAGNMNVYAVGNPTTITSSSVGYTNLNSSGTPSNLSVSGLLANSDSSLYIGNVTTQSIKTISLADGQFNKLNVDLLDVLNHGVLDVLKLNLGVHPQFKIDGDLTGDQVRLTNNLGNPAGWTAHETLTDSGHTYTHYSGNALGLQVDLLIDQNVKVTIV
ncbi:Ig-like domain-containing protein [Limnohabitans sp. Jir72]|uniref:Ig-like domain-containing protein n=1 Tax=Limnohabitans sp. Jir72 TaxID=1977909 RepID=UPI0011B294A0|nr:Ig-like domain-containing protein [Limnohabitans sp. Jir72]